MKAFREDLKNNPALAAQYNVKIKSKGENCICIFLLLLNYFYLLILKRSMYTCIRDRINY